MLLRKTIKAFTLTETLVALVLMVIIIGLASSIISITSSNLKIIRKNESKYRDYEQAEFIISLDFSRNREFSFKDSVITIKNEMDSLKYRFTKRTPDNKDIMLIRKNDTLLIDNFKISLYYNGNNVSQGKFDAIEISSLDFKQRVFVTKPEDVKQKLSVYGL